MITKKVCKRCNKNLDKTEFYAKAKSSDGLQDWCKKCQNNYNSKRVEKVQQRKHWADLKRLSTYHLTHGLEYKFANPKKNGESRKMIIYKCLKCGHEVKSTIQTAWEKHFICNKCSNELLTDKVIQKTKRVKVDSIDDICTCNKPIQEQPLRKNPKVIIVQVPVYKERKPSKLLTWFKNLFKKK